MKKLLVVTGLAMILLAACSAKQSSKIDEKNAEMVQNEEQVGKVIDGKEYIVKKMEKEIIYLEDADQSKKGNAVQMNKFHIIETSLKGAKRNGMIDVGDYVVFEKKAIDQYVTTITKDVVGEIKYDGTIKYKILEVTNNVVKWLPLNKENNGGAVPPEMIKVVNDKKIRPGNIVTIKELEPNPQNINFELTIVE
ncbi:hypothetical protein D0U04_14600 [Bacillus clarus]|uniref:Lipoprotein n=1 Tax=Bacillus clarus TaxID=2338372 RepID=A0A090YS44_9BACI|nr:hypothetical protein [Bacillus clarus]KFN01057.1 hypothetical protein DJ93_3567 [Bacillus clarus]RFT66217.1 hypothetical protein D0U04_14600 [Bacillus clarus]